MVHQLGNGRRPERRQFGTVWQTVLCTGPGKAECHSLGPRASGVREITGHRERDARPGHQAFRCAGYMEKFSVGNRLATTPDAIRKNQRIELLSYDHLLCSASV